jgi:hypothetical protein
MRTGHVGQELVSHVHEIALLTHSSPHIRFATFHITVTSNRQSLSAPQFQCLKINNGMEDVRISEVRMILEPLHRMVKQTSFKYTTSLKYPLFGR